MDFKYAIFDMDGTLFDSNRLWRYEEIAVAGKLTGYNLTQEDIAKFELLSVPEIKSKFYDLTGKEIDPDLYLKSIYDNMHARYDKGDIDPKPYMYEYLDYLKKKGIKIGLATATPKALMINFLKNKGIYKYFDTIKTVHDDAHVSKFKGPDVYLMAMEALGGTKENTAVFEDAVEPIRTTTSAGLYTVAIEDSIQRNSVNEIKSLVQKYIISYKEMM